MILSTFGRRLSHFRCAVIAVCVLACSGCGSGIHGPFPPVDPDVGGVVTGNWQFSLTPKARGSSGIEFASGSIDQSSTADGSGQFTTSVLLVQAPCFVLSPVLPLQGSSTNTQLTLSSFVVNGQFVSIHGTITGSGGVLNGSYTVSGGCADGEIGTISGTRISPLNGNYSTRSNGTSPLAITASLAQSSKSNGDGVFLVSGTSIFSGYSCFSKGAIATGSRNGYVSGSALQIAFTTDEPGGSSLVLQGTVSSDASKITYTTRVTGGGCSGQTSSGVLYPPQ